MRIRLLLSSYVPEFGEVHRAQPDFGFVNHHELIVHQAILFIAHDRHARLQQRVPRRSVSMFVDSMTMRTVTPRS